MKLSARGRLWLKGVHIVFSVVLLGGAACILLLRGMNWSDSAHLHAIDYAILIVEQGIIIPAATGSLLTGFLESRLTNWGFIRYRWVIVKWAATLDGRIADGRGRSAWITSEASRRAMRLPFSG